MKDLNFGRPRFQLAPHRWSRPAAPKSRRQPPTPEHVVENAIHLVNETVHHVKRLDETLAASQSTIFAPRNLRPFLSHAPPPFMLSGFRTFLLSEFRTSS